MKVRTTECANLVKSSNNKGESRTMIKQIGDLNQLFDCLKQDLKELQDKNEILFKENEELKKEVKSQSEQLIQIGSKYEQKIQQISLQYQQEIHILKEESQLKLSQIQSQLEVKISQLLKEKEEFSANLEEKIQQNNIFKQQIKQLKDVNFIQEQLFQKNQIELIEHQKGVVAQLQSNIHTQQLEQNLLIQQHQIEKEKIIKENEDKVIVIKKDSAMKQIIISQLEGDLKQIQEKVINLDEKQSQQNNELLLFQSDNLKYKDLNMKLSEQVKQEKNETIKCNSLIQELENNISNLKSEIDQQISKIQSIKENNSLQIQILEEDREQERQQLHSKYSNTIDKLRREHQQLIEKDTKERFVERQQFEEMRNEMIAAMEKDSQKFSGVLKQQLTEMTREKNISLEAQRKLKEERDQMIKSNTERERAQKQTFDEQLEKEIQMRDQIVKEQIEKDKEEMENIKIQLKKEKEDLENQKKQELEKMNERIQGLICQNSQEQNIIYQEWQNKYSQLQSEYQKQSLELNGLLNSQKIAHQKQLQETVFNYEDQIKQLQHTIKMNTKEISKDLDQKNQQEIEVIKNKNKEQVSKINANWEIKYKELNDEFNAKLELQQQKNTQDYDQYLLVKKELTSLKFANEAQLLEFKKQSEREQEQIRQNNTKELSQLRTSVGVVEQVTSELLGQRTQLEEEKGNLHFRIKKLVEDLLDLKKKKILEEQQQQKEKISTKEEYLIIQEKQQSQFDLQNKLILQEQLKYIEKMKNDFNELIKKHQMELKQQEKEYKELETFFRQRPSRPDDLRHIQNLTIQISKFNQIISEKDKEVSKANQIVNYLQMELENEKNIYNIFRPNQKNSSMIDLSVSNSQAEISKNDQILLKQNKKQGTQNDFQNDNICQNTLQLKQNQNTYLSIEQQQQMLSLQKLQQQPKLQQTKNQLNQKRANKLKKHSSQGYYQSSSQQSQLQQQQQQQNPLNLMGDNLQNNSMPFQLTPLNITQRLQSSLPQKNKPTEQQNKWVNTKISNQNSNKNIFIDSNAGIFSSPIKKIRSVSLDPEVKNFMKQNQNTKELITQSFVSNSNSNNSNSNKQISVSFSKNKDQSPSQEKISSTQKSLNQIAKPFSVKKSFTLSSGKTSNNFTHCSNLLQRINRSSIMHENSLQSNSLLLQNSTQIQQQDTNDSRLYSSQCNSQHAFSNPIENNNLISKPEKIVQLKEEEEFGKKWTTEKEDQSNYSKELFMKSERIHQNQYEEKIDNMSKGDIIIEVNSINKNKEQLLLDDNNKKKNSLNCSNLEEEFLLNCKNNKSSIKKYSRSRNIQKSKNQERIKSFHTEGDN